MKLLGRVGIYVEALWALFHPIKILEMEISTYKLFTDIEISSLKQRVRELEKQHAK